MHRDPIMPKLSRLAIKESQLDYFREKIGGKIKGNMVNRRNTTSKMSLKEIR